MMFTYAGICGVALEPETFDLGHGVTLSRTYVHAMSTMILAFARPEKPGSHHPPPWKAGMGGYDFDVTVELKMPSETPLSPKLSTLDTIWWICALLRAGYHPHVLAPVTSEMSFSEVSKNKVEAKLTALEVIGRVFKLDEKPLTTEELEWVREIWVAGGKLLLSEPKFYTAFKAFDFATIRGRPSSALLALWGGLEQLFAPSKGELRFRVAALLASYHEPPGQARYDLYKHILKMYDQRSTAAHTAEDDIEDTHITGSYVLMRNSLIKILKEGKLPTQKHLEGLLFGCDTVPASDATVSEPSGDS